MATYLPGLAGAHNMPVRWREIFSEEILKVASCLGVSVKATPNRADNCIWVSIEPSERYSQDSSDNLSMVGPYAEGSSLNLNIIGFDYHRDKDPYDDYFSLVLVIGVKNYWYNKKLLPFLFRAEDDCAKVDNHYSGCRFDRSVRFNRFRCTFYQDIESYDLLCDCLQEVCASGVYFPKLTPDQCLRKLNALGVTEGDAIDKLRTYNYSDYNWLEYLTIVPKEEICMGRLLEGDVKEIAELDRQIELHLRGMLLLDEIYRKI